MENTVTLQAVVGAIRTSGHASRRRSKGGIGRTSGMYAYRGIDDKIFIVFTNGDGIYNDNWLNIEKKIWDSVNAHLATKGMKVEKYNGQKIVVAA